MFNAHTLAIKQVAVTRSLIAVVAMCSTECQLAASSDGTRVPGELVIPDASPLVSQFLSRRSSISRATRHSVVQHVLRREAPSVNL